MPKTKDLPREGIYYVLRYPDGWQLTVKRFGSDVDYSHPVWFEEEVAAMIANGWAKKLGKSPQVIERRIKSLCYGFPRGRVTKVGDETYIYHGADLTPAMGMETTDEIAGAFEITGKFWSEFDEHEQCQVGDRDEMRRYLGIKDKWCAV